MGDVNVLISQVVQQPRIVIMAVNDRLRCVIIPAGHPMDHASLHVVTAVR